MTDIVKITIDGKEIKANKGTNLLNLAQNSGIDIPSLCYHPKLTPTGACRLCICKVKGIDGLVASCTLSAEEGMEVIAFDEELEGTRKYLLDYLLSEHNEADDGSYYDEFQELIEHYGLDNPKQRKFPSIWQDLNYPIDDSSPVLSYDASKCIKCFRCIKACDEVQGKNVLSFAERGIHSFIKAGIKNWQASECDGCGECIQLCPTGAIVEKLNRHNIRFKEIEKKVKTTCPYCGVGCQIELLIQDDKIVRSNGVSNVKPNDGRLCVKGRFGFEFVHSKERLTRPLIKKNGKFIEIDWDEALDHVAQKFLEIKRQFGADALAGYSSAKCTNEENYIFQKFIRTVFGTNNVDYCTRLCHSSTVTAMLRSIGDGAGSNSIEDYEKADCILVTGNNIIETHPVTATFIKRGKSNGAKILVIDPKWTPLVKIADLWLQPRLGTDVALLNGLIRLIIKDDMIDKTFITNRVEKGMQALKDLKKSTLKYTPDYVEKLTGVPAQDLADFAMKFGQSKSILIATGMGLSQQITGTNNVLALINLCLITGQIGKEGSGINPPRGQNNVQGATDVGASPIYYPGYISVLNEVNRKKVAKIWEVDFDQLSATPGLTTVEIMQAAHDQKIKGMYIMGENPIMTDPNINHTIEALKKLEFLVVQDLFLTETANYAHVIFPAASFAEKNGTFVTSDRRVVRVRKSVDIPGEAKEDWKIIVSLAEKMAQPMKRYADESEIFDEITKVAPIFGGITYNRIEHEGIQWPCPTKDHPGTSTLFLEKFNTSSGKAIITPVEYVPPSENADAEYPFLLNTGRILYHYHSCTMSRKSQILTQYANTSYVMMNPVDVEKFGFSEGESVKVSSKRGFLKTQIRTSNQVSPGELFIPFHYSESPVNMLTRDVLDPYSKMPPFKLSACKVEKI